ncbi:8226_t:CDS:2 [Funneliformis geosporum]|uniref:4561_t:CDS:1 n=1 Tax=Funneliformis geosporum TaxID=1117311 RepID=A0A9W4SKN2_9GLOM|nr:4561_t:CDS:2 [Funneliformis geosporum]CAI2175585.1 8226_t:CDS:2 [Funneliformis geosporum]
METYHGRIETLNDALIIFVEACQQGILQRTTRRLLEKEREELCGGNVYVFDETESGIKRWTDGRLWSPSRIIKDFLVYRELATRDRNIKRHEPLDELLQKRISAEGLKVHQCSKGLFLLRKDGLLKKTISIKFNGTYQHMVIYEDVIKKNSSAEPLLPPRAFEELRYLQLGEDILNSEKMPKANRNYSRKSQKKWKEHHQTHRLLKQLVFAQTDQQRQQNYQLYYQTGIIGGNSLIGGVLSPDQTYLWNNSRQIEGSNGRGEMSNNFAINDLISSEISPSISSFDPYGNHQVLNALSFNRLKFQPQNATTVDLTSNTPLLSTPWSPNHHSYPSTCGSQFQQQSSNLQLSVNNNIINGLSVQLIAASTNSNNSFNNPAITTNTNNMIGNTEDKDSISDISDSDMKEDY